MLSHRLLLVSHRSTIPQFDAVMKIKTFPTLGVVLLGAIFTVSPGLAKVGDTRHLTAPPKKHKNKPAKNITPGPIPPEKALPQNEKAHKVPLKKKNKNKPTTMKRMQNVPSPRRNDEELVVVMVVTDNYPMEVGWEIRDDTNDEVAWVTTGTYEYANYFYEDEVYLEKGKTYTFEIYDEACDGLCCGYGYGWYNVMTSVWTGGFFLADGSSYGCSERTEFVVPH